MAHLRPAARKRNIAVAIAGAMAVAMAGWSIAAPGGAQPTSAPTDASPSTPPRCNEQQPDPVLIRGNWVIKARMPPEEQQRRRELHQQAIRIRTERYGYFEGFGRPEWNPHPPTYYARRVTLWGLSVRVHERIIPALQCAARAVSDHCASTPYRPQRLSGIRDRNTYHNGEVSNHVYGIAIDIDPHRNTCCGCVAPWNEHPLCRRPVSSIFERMAMPECWVRQFQRLGFYWLGDDELQDTMHFEFLADPDRILAP